jgi:hypothetical protein
MTLEREITGSFGLMASNLPKGFSWLRFPDDGGPKRNSLGADGLLLFGRGQAFLLEVKVGKGKLTKSEEKLFKWCFNNGRPYFVLNYYEKPTEIWVLGDLVFGGVWSGSLKEVVENLIDYV